MDMQMVKQTGSEKPRGGIQLTELRKLVNDEEFSAAKLTDELFPGGLVSKQDAVALVRYLCHLPITWDEAGRAMNAILGHAYPCPSAQVWDAIEIVHLTWKVIARTVPVARQVNLSGCMQVWLACTANSRDPDTVIGHQLSVTPRSRTISRPVDAYVIAATLPDKERKAWERKRVGSPNPATGPKLR